MFNPSNYNRFDPKLLSISKVADDLFYVNRYKIFYDAKELRITVPQCEVNQFTDKFNQPQIKLTCNDINFNKFKEYYQVHKIDCQYYAGIITEIAWERPEIHSRSLETLRELWWKNRHNKGQIWYGPQAEYIKKRQKNREELYQKRH